MASLGGVFDFDYDGAAAPGKVEKITENAADSVAEGIVAVPKMLGSTIRKGIVAPPVAIENLKRPAVGIVHGREIKYHREQIESLLEETDVIVLDGEMIFAFYKAQGLSVGSTPVSDEDVQLATSILDKANAKGLRLVLPTHVVVADSDDRLYANTKIVAASEIPDGWIGVDAAPETIELVAEALKGARTIVWSGSEIGSDSATTEGIEKLIEEHVEKGAWAILLGQSISVPRESVGKRFQHNADELGKAFANTAHAIAEGIAAVPKKIFGFHMQKGVNSSGTLAIEDLNRPAAAIVGGAQVEYKKEQIESLLEEVDVLILGGEMIFSFYKAQGLSVGSSPESDNNVQLAKSILDKAKERGVNVILPKHAVVADSDKEYANTKIVAASEIPDGWIGVDVAPESVELIADALEGVRTIVWNGELVGSSSYSDLTMEGFEKLIEEHEEKGVRILKLDHSFSTTENTDFNEPSIEKRKIDAEKIGMFHFGG